MTPKKIYIYDGSAKDLAIKKNDRQETYILESEHNRLVEELKAEHQKEIKNMSEIIKDLCRQTTTK